MAWCRLCWCCHKCLLWFEVSEGCFKEGAVSQMSYMEPCSHRFRDLPGSMSLPSLKIYPPPGFIAMVKFIAVVVFTALTSPFIPQLLATLLLDLGVPSIINLIQHLNLVQQRRTQKKGPMHWHSSLTLSSPPPPEAFRSRLQPPQGQPANLYCSTGPTVFSPLKKVLSSSYIS